MKNIIFLFENFQFLEVKFSIYLNRRVFVTISPTLFAFKFFVGNHSVYPLRISNLCSLNGM